MIIGFLTFTAGFFVGNYVMVKYPTMYTAIINKGKQLWAKVTNSSYTPKE